MSAILSADDLNDFISPGVACIKPVETLPKQQAPKVSHEEMPPPTHVLSLIWDCDRIHMK